MEQREELSREESMIVHNDAHVILIIGYILRACFRHDNRGMESKDL